MPALAAGSGGSTGEGQGTSPSSSLLSSSLQQQKHLTESQLSADRTSLLPVLEQKQQMGPGSHAAGEENQAAQKATHLPQQVRSWES